MKGYLRFLFVALIIAATLSVTNTTHACIPLGGVAPPCSAYWDADAVFVGSITEITDAPPEPNEILKYLLLHFAVEEPYRGVESSEVAVATITGTECSRKYQVGERWLVYARRQSPTGRLEMWTRTTLYSNANEDLAYIRGLSEHAPESSIFARVFIHPYTPLEGTT